MKRTLILNVIIGILIVTILVVFDYSYLDVFLSNTDSSKTSKVVIIDAGHGGIDGGAVGHSGTLEKDINLLISKKLKAYLEEHGFTCIMVREVDEGLYSQSGTIRNKKNEDLKNRKTIIKEYHGDIFISVHLNKFPEAKYYGAQVFYPKGDEDSHRLAKSVQDELKKVIDRGNTRIEKPADTYYLIRGNTIPSIIVECGFLSNPEEEQLLKDENYQNKLAWSIYSGLIKYITQPESIQLN